MPSNRDINLEQITREDEFTLVNWVRCLELQREHRFVSVSVLKEIDATHVLLAGHRLPGEAIATLEDHAGSAYIPTGILDLDADPQTALHKVALRVHTTDDQIATADAV